MILLFWLSVKFDTWFYKKHGHHPDIEGWTWGALLFTAVASLVAMIAWMWIYCTYKAVLQFLS